MEKTEVEDSSEATLQVGDSLLFKPHHQQRGQFRIEKGIGKKRQASVRGPGIASISLD